MKKSKKPLSKQEYSTRVFNICLIAGALMFAASTAFSDMGMLTKILLTLFWICGAIWFTALFVYQVKHRENDE